MHWEKSFHALSDIVKKKARTLLWFEEHLCKEGGDFWTDGCNLQLEMEETE